MAIYKSDADFWSGVRYLENIFTSVVMIVFPKQVPVVGMLAGVFTVAKWMLLGASFILLILRYWLQGYGGGTDKTAAIRLNIYWLLEAY